MGFEIVTGDVLDTTTDALLLTIDGGKSGMEGSIARQFAKRFPEDWEFMQRDLKYPVPIGRTVAIPWDGDCPWRVIMFASTLHHVGVLDDVQKLRVIRSACAEALQLCVRLRINSLATAVLQGGWRLSAQQALSEMKLAYQGAACPQVKLLVCQPTSADSNGIDITTKE